MPLGIQRLNARSSAHPTPHIGFIRALPGPSAAEAEKLLAQVAAICHPILATHHLAVMALTEHEPNREFLGRNFNAGETIELVLRRRRTGDSGGSSGDFLPFRNIVLVMLHELAHCTHMHHRAAFWRTRDAYATEMRALWARGYTGEGIWGRGRALGSGDDHTALPLDAGLSIEVCGGAYRRQRRRRGAGTKRKREHEHETSATPPLSYAERQQRRIRRKFGVGGTALGADQAARDQLARGSRGAQGYGAPRVAQSARGRELRAQAALARLGVPAAPLESAQGKLPFTPLARVDGNAVEESLSETDSGSESGDDAEAELVQVCPETSRAGADDAGSAARVAAERQELFGPHESQDTESSGNRSSEPASVPPAVEIEPGESCSEVEQRDAAPSDRAPPKPSPADWPCPVCSLVNGALAACCEACGCVLRPDRVPGHWRCERKGCAESAYINAGDYGVCGVCGERRKASGAQAVLDGKDG